MSMTTRKEDAIFLGSQWNDSWNEIRKELQAGTQVLPEKAHAFFMHLYETVLGKDLECAKGGGVRVMMQGQNCLKVVVSNEEGKKIRSLRYAIFLPNTPCDGASATPSAAGAGGGGGVPLVAAAAVVPPTSAQPQISPYHFQLEDKPIEFQEVTWRKAHDGTPAKPEVTIKKSSIKDYIHALYKHVPAENFTQNVPTGTFMTNHLLPALQAKMFTSGIPVVFGKMDTIRVEGIKRGAQENTLVMRVAYQTLERDWQRVDCIVEVSGGAAQEDV